MFPASIDLLKLSFSQLFNQLDSVSPGDEDIEYEMNTIKDHLHYMALSSKEIKDYAAIVEKSLQTIEGMVDEKIKNPYKEFGFM